jgi:hypothetical protein
MHPCPLTVLFHADAGVEATLEQLFQSRTWTHVDLATMTHSPLKKFKKRLFGQTGNEIRNVCIRHPGHRHKTSMCSRAFLNSMYANSRCLRLKVVVHFNEFVAGSLGPMCICNADWILVKKRGPGNGHGWDPHLFDAAGVPLERVDTSTCDLVGVTLDYASHRMAFVEVRFEDEPAARERIRARCAAIAEELMQVTWRPDRGQAP